MILTKLSEILIGILVFVLVVAIGIYMILQIGNEMTVWKRVCDSQSENYTIETVCSPYEPRCWNCTEAYILFYNTTEMVS